MRRLLAFILACALATASTLVGAALTRLAAHAEPPQPGTFLARTFKTNAALENTAPLQNNGSTSTPLPCGTDIQRRSITCATVNSTASLSILGYNPGDTQYLADDTITVRLAGPGGATNFPAANTDWPLTPSVADSTAYIAPNNQYSVSRVTNGRRALVGLERYIGAIPDTPDRAWNPPVASENWQQASMGSIVVEGGQAGIYRLVFTESNPTLPLTGGRASAWFLLGGGLLTLLAGVGYWLYLVHRRRE